VDELSQGLVTVTKNLHERLVKLDAMQRKLAARLEAKVRASEVPTHAHLHSRERIVHA